MAGPWDFYPSLDPAQTAGTIYDQPIMRPLFRWGGPQVPSGENALAASQKQDAVWEQTPGSPYNLREQLKPWQQGVVNFLETPGGQATMFLANVLGPGAKPMRPVPTASALLDRAARMPQFKPDTWSFRNLFDRQMKPPGFIEKEPFSLSDVRETGRTTEDVPLRDIRTTQPSVSVRAVKDKFNNPGSDDGRIPSVFKYGDAYYVNDGNHRIAAGKARGAGTIQAEVIGLQDKTSPAAIAGPANVPQEPMGSAAAPAPEVGQTGTRAYHGSPKEFSEFKTPAFFSPYEGVARGYKLDGGGADNLNGLSVAQRLPKEYRVAAAAVDKAGGDRTAAIEALRAPPTEPPVQVSLFERLFGPSKASVAERQLDAEDRALTHKTNSEAARYIESGAPTGTMYEVALAEPTAHYPGINQSAEIADAVRAGHKVIRMGPSEIVAVDPSGIQAILRRYGLAGMMAGLGGAAANQTDAKP